jgi:hypothetical protein
MTPAEKALVNAVLEALPREDVEAFRREVVQERITPEMRDAVAKCSVAWVAYVESFADALGAMRPLGEAAEGVLRAATHEAQKKARAK